MRTIILPERMKAEVIDRLATTPLITTVDGVQTFENIEIYDLPDDTYFEFDCTYDIVFRLVSGRTYDSPPEAICPSVECRITAVRAEEYDELEEEYVECEVEFDDGELEELEEKIEQAIMKIAEN